MPVSKMRLRAVVNTACETAGGQVASKSALEGLSAAGPAGTAGKLPPARSAVGGTAAALAEPP